jgi:hypothetical protein
MKRTFSRRNLGNNWALTETCRVHLNMLEMEYKQVIYSYVIGILPCDGNKPIKFSSLLTDGRYTKFSNLLLSNRS